MGIKKSYRKSRALESESLWMSILLLFNSFVVGHLPNLTTLALISFFVKYNNSSLTELFWEVKEIIDINS